MHDALSDSELLGSFAAVTKAARYTESELLRLLGEIDARKLYAAQGYSSMFAYCREVGKFSEGCACRRIAAARAARRFPRIYAMVEDGRLHVTAVATLAPHLTDANHGELLAGAVGKGKLELEALVAPKAAKIAKKDRIAMVRVRETEAPAAGPVAEDGFRLGSGEERRASPVESAEPVAEIRFSCPAHLLPLIERAKDVLAHVHPEGRLADVMEEALKALLAARDPQARAARVEARRAKAKQPNQPARVAKAKADVAPLAPTRRSPAHVARAVLLRDGGRCVYRSPDGRICGSTHGIQIDHLRPYALGGRSDDPDQLRCLCRTHNRWRAEKTFGRFTATGGGHRRPSG